MRSKPRALTEEQFIQIGQAHDSDAIASEAAEAALRWSRDLLELAPYGYGSQAFRGFEQDRIEQSTLRMARPQLVAHKANLSRARRTLRTQAWRWVDKVGSVLQLLARTNEMLAARLDSAIPSDDSNLDAGLAALGTLLAEVRPTLPAEVQAEARLLEYHALSEQLTSAVGMPASQDGALDTRRLDLIDGRLLIAVWDLNQAAARAIRHGELGATISEYRFHYVEALTEQTVSMSSTRVALGPEPQVSN